jgi:hypothetical protein
MTTDDKCNTSTYTMGLMTCHILPGVHAREYIVRSSSRAFNIIDLVVFVAAITLFHKLKVRISEEMCYLYTDYCSSLILIQYHCW